MINENELRKALMRGLTIKEIALDLNVTQYLVKKSLKFYGLQTSFYLKNWDIERLKELSNSCNSKREVLLKMGLRDSNANYLTLEKVAEFHSIIIPDGVSVFSKNVSIKDSDFFAENTDRKGPAIKKRLLKMGFKEECAICNLGTEWNGIQLKHHVDHINGVHTDNRLENLRLLCPNCHSQQETTSKNKVSRKVFYYCLSCDKKINRNSERCQKCSNILINSKRRRFDPTIDELKSILKEYNYNMSAVGRHYNVSDNAVRKRCKALNISL